MKTAAPVRAFGWDRFELSSRLTAAGQLTAATRDAHGLVASVAASKGGRDVERYAYDRAATRYAYDAAGRLVKEGGRTYRYGWLDKVLSVAGGGKSFTYSYHADGQLARADYGGGRLVSDWGLPDILANVPTMPIAYVFGFLDTSYDKFVDFINYLQDQLRMPNVKPIWLEYCSCKE